MEEVLRYSQDEYESYGFALTRYNGKYAIANISHCSCFGTEYDEVENTLTLKEVIKLAENQSDPRVPDVKTTDEFLLGLYKMILEFKEELKDNTWIGPKVNTLMFYEGSFQVRIIFNKAYDKKKLKLWYEKHLYSIPHISNVEIKIIDDIIYVKYYLTIKNKAPLDEIPGKYYLPDKKYPYVKLELIH